MVEDPSPLKQVYDPKHPLADEKGYVAMPNVNVVDEMVNMLSASRSYQTNVETMNAVLGYLTEHCCEGAACVVETQARRVAC